MTAVDARRFERAIATFGAAPGGGRAFLASPGALAFVAAQADEIAGWCWGYHLIRPDACSMLYLHRLEVAPEHRRRGVGRALLQAFMAAGVQAGAARMFLTTSEANAAARALYESLGGGPAAQGPTVSYWFRLRPDATASAAGRALLLTGVAGVGKSTVADAIGRELTAAGHATAVVDTDHLAQFGPPPNPGPGGEGLYDELKCANLASVWTNFRAAGARCIVASAVIGTAALRERYARSLTGCDVRVVRLVADVDTIRTRLRRRDAGPKLQRHLSALEQAARSPSAAPVEDFTVPNDRTPAEVATAILARAGWSDRPGVTA